MRKLYSVILISMMSLAATAQTTINLPSPNKNVSMPLYTALQYRQSVRSYLDKAIDDATLSQVLWAACGINRPDQKKLTVPSCMNKQDISVYVVRADGAYLYDPAQNTLNRVSAKDLRSSVASRQQGVANAPVMLVLVSDVSKIGGDKAEHFGAIDAGYVSQNIYLACTSLGLGTVARATMDESTLKKELNLSKNQVLELNHPIGWNPNPVKMAGKQPFHFEVMGDAPQPNNASSTTNETPVQEANDEIHIK